MVIDDDIEVDYFQEGAGGDSGREEEMFLVEEGEEEEEEKEGFFEAEDDEEEMAEALVDDIEYPTNVEYEEDRYIDDDETTATIEAEEPFDEAESWAKQDLLRMGTSEMTGGPIHLDIEDSGMVVEHTESEKRSKELYVLMQNHQVKKSAKDAIIKWINKTYHPNQSKDESLKSVWLSEKLLSESTALNEKRYDMCTNGCMMFLRDEELRCFFFVMRQDMNNLKMDLASLETRSPN